MLINMSECIYLLFLLLFAINCAGRELPSYFPKCYIDDPNLNDCILNASRILKPQIIKGVKEIKLPSFDPLVVSPFGASQNSMSLNYNVSFTNFIVRGLEDYDFDEITYDPSTLILMGKVRFNNITFQSNYKVNGSLIYFPVVGSGVVETKLGSANGTFEIKGKLKTRKGLEYYWPTSVKVGIKSSDLSVYFSGLFDNDPELVLLTNELINLNGEQILDAAAPPFEMLVEAFLMKFMKTLTKLIPYNKLFPHS